jgi:UDP-3-O-[3-hydroxymyristoyl] glucosamine N-acyltransferase
MLRKTKVFHIINKAEKPTADRKALIAHAELSTQPLIGKETTVHESAIGYACEIGDRCRVSHTILDEYSYLSSDCDVSNATIGKFCSIASHVRINPGNHPLPRAPYIILLTELLAMV